MVIEKAEIGASGIAKLEAEGTSFFVRLEFWEFLGREAEELRPGSTLGEEALVDLVLAAKATEAEARGASLLGRAEQPRFLLHGKLLERGYPDRAVVLALDRLEREGYLSDARYAEAWLRARIGKALRSAVGGGRAEGPSSLLLSLRARSIGERVAKAALTAVLEPGLRAELLASALGKLRASSREGPPSRDELRRSLRELGWSGEEIRDHLED